MPRGIVKMSCPAHLVPDASFLVATQRISVFCCEQSGDSGSQLSRILGKRPLANKGKEFGSVIPSHVSTVSPVYTLITNWLGYTSSEGDGSGSGLGRKPISTLAFGNEDSYSSSVSFSKLFDVTLTCAKIRQFNSSGILK